jgi:hypothetical protein
MVYEYFLTHCVSVRSRIRTSHLNIRVSKTTTSVEVIFVYKDISLKMLTFQTVILYQTSNEGEDHSRSARKDTMYLLLNTKLHWPATGPFPERDNCSDHPHITLMFMSSSVLRSSLPNILFSFSD